GNLHYNLFPAKGRRREDYANLKPVLTRIVHDLIDAHGGSISAEHGIGRFKTADLAHYGDPAKLAAMRAIKAALDPAGIMNPGAVLG
ncbi:MAG: FAD-linked oxidase C-terminal domain-containing protein, partial [Pseudomonadota bacterium]|nr:FAD-linked oxidase C-terminal domain-containing protein [Pseudomonadota bacterium]